MSCKGPKGSVSTFVPLALATKTCRRNVRRQMIRMFVQKTMYHYMIVVCTLVHEMVKYVFKWAVHELSGIVMPALALGGRPEKEQHIMSYFFLSLSPVDYSATSSYIFRHPCVVACSAIIVSELSL
eukprot:4637391-Amphidinium_carterae.1